MVSVKVFAVAMLAVFLASCMIPMQGPVYSVRFDMPESDIELVEERLNEAGVSIYDLKCNEGLCLLKFPDKYDPQMVIWAIQAEFEMRIEDEIWMGPADFESVCKETMCNVIRDCKKAEDSPAPNLYRCHYSVTATLTEEAAEGLAEATGRLESEGNYLSKELAFYLDGEKIDSVLISRDLKGKAVTDIAISGWTFPGTMEESQKWAKNMIKIVHASLSTDVPPKISNIDVSMG